MTSNGADVVICGGGVIGAAIAYYLGKRGVAAVIVEADGVASGASGAAAGLLSPPNLQQSRGSMAELIRTSFDMHATLAETLPGESGVEYEYAPSPRLSLAETEGEAVGLRREADVMRAAGLPGRWLSPREVRERCPWLDRPLLGALEGEPSAQLDAYKYTLALITAAERMGARVRNGRVSRIEVDAGRATGVRIGDRLIATDSVIVAMGPWSADAGSWLGCPLPVEPLKGQIVRLRPAKPLPLIGFTDQHDDYVLPKRSGLVYLGTTMERVGFDPAPTLEARDRILAIGARFSSILEAAEVIEQTACLRPLSPDDLPIMGAVPGVDGAYVATGHGRKGILLSTASGKAMADLIVEGRTDCVDLAPFDPARFAVS